MPRAVSCCAAVVWGGGIFSRQIRAGSRWPDSPGATVGLPNSAVLRRARVASLPFRPVVGRQAADDFDRFEAHPDDLADEGDDVFLVVGPEGTEDDSPGGHRP